MAKTTDNTHTIKELAALQAVIDALKPLEPDAQRRILFFIADLYDLNFHR